MSRNLNSSQFSEVPLFDPGPEQDPDTYWHLSHEGEDWNPEPRAMHFGTPQAAMERGQNVRRHARGGDPMDGTAHAVKLRIPMANPKSMPMSDSMANVLSDRSADADYYPDAIEEVAYAQGMMGAGNLGAGFEPDESAAFDYLDEEGDRFRTEEAGAYYRNAHEDKDSISVVVNDPTRHVQHLGTVGYEPEFRNEVRGMAADPITGKQRSAAFTEIRRGTADVHGVEPNEVLGPQFNWEQPTL